MSPGHGVGFGRGCAKVSLDTLSRAEEAVTNPSVLFPACAHRHAALNRLGVLVAMSMLSRGGECVTWTSVLARMADVSVSTAKAAVDALLKSGMIEPLPGGGPPETSHARRVRITPYGRDVLILLADLRDTAKVGGRVNGVGTHD